MIILLLAYHLGALFFILSKRMTHNIDQFTFYNEYKLHQNTDWKNLLTFFYFMHTTLSSTGMGDYNPKSETERIYIILILLIGVFCCSYAIE